MEQRASLDRGLADYRRAQEINADRAEAQVNLRILADRVLRLDQPRRWRSGSYPGLRAHVAIDRAGASRGPSALPGARPRRSLRPARSFESWLLRGWNRGGHPHPLPGLRHAVAEEHVLSMRVHDLALDHRLSVTRRGREPGRLRGDGLLLIHDRRLWCCVGRVRIRVIRISIIWIRPVRIRQSGTEREGTKDGGTAPPAASTVMVVGEVTTHVAPVTPTHVAPAPAPPLGGVHRDGDADDQNDDAPHGERAAPHHRYSWPTHEAPSLEPFRTKADERNSDGPADRDPPAAGTG